MKDALKMENGYMEVAQELALTVITFTGAYIGIDSIPVPVGQNIIQIILSPAAENTLDTSLKFLILFSTAISCITGGIVIYKAVRAIRK